MYANMRYVFLEPEERYSFRLIFLELKLLEKFIDLIMLSIAASRCSLEKTFFVSAVI